MFAFIFAGILLAGLLAIAFGISKIFRFIYRKVGAVPIALLVAALAAWPVVAWKRYEYRNTLSLVPASLNVTSIRFEASESMGFGPGGSAAGLLIFDLPDVVARRIAHDGISYFGAMERSPKSRTGHKDYWNWQQTPAVHPGIPVDSKLCMYDACSNIPVEVQKQVNAIAASTDSYFALGRNAIIVVSPREKTVIVHYDK